MNRPPVPAELVAGQRSLFARMRREATRGHRRVGWKIGHAIEEVDALGGGVPVVGWLSSRTVLSAGDTYRARGARALRGETEIAIELARAVEPDAEDDDVRSAIAGLRVALEIVDVARPPCDARGIIEGNVFHRAVAFGDRLAPHSGAPGRATLCINGRIHPEDERPPCVVSAVRGVARMLAESGETLAPGDRILSGSLIHLPIAPGDDLRAGVGGLGEVCVRIGR